MPIVRTFDQKSTKISTPFDRVIRVLVAPDTQEAVKGVSITHCVIAPKSSTDLRHTHPGLEMMYIMSGSGECTIGDETHAIGPNVLMICPPGVPHDIRNYSDETMSLVAMFLPPETSKQILERAENASKAVNK